jgi:hypothetical protein
MELPDALVELYIIQVLFLIVGVREIARRFARGVRDARRSQILPPPPATLGVLPTMLASDGCRRPQTTRNRLTN